MRARVGLGPTPRPPPTPRHPLLLPQEHSGSLSRTFGSRHSSSLSRTFSVFSGELSVLFSNTSEAEWRARMFLLWRSSLVLL